MPEAAVRLPPRIQPPFDVYVNGVPQHQGEDYELRGDALIFRRELATEGKLGLWRWIMGAFGVGTYRQNDSVDIRYEIEGRPMVAAGLPIVARSPVGADPPVS